MQTECSQSDSDIERSGECAGIDTITLRPSLTVHLANTSEGNYYAIFIKYKKYSKNLSNSKIAKN